MCLQESREQLIEKLAERSANPKKVRRVLERREYTKEHLQYFVRERVCMDTHIGVNGL